MLLGYGREEDDLSNDHFQNGELNLAQLISTRNSLFLSLDSYIHIYMYKLHIHICYIYTARLR